jgi:hypothetical protein
MMTVDLPPGQCTCSTCLETAEAKARRVTYQPMALPAEAPRDCEAALRELIGFVQDALDPTRAATLERTQKLVRALMRAQDALRR